MKYNNCFFYIQIRYKLDQTRFLLLRMLISVLLQKVITQKGFSVETRKFKMVYYMIIARVRN